jgi:hypothetical protein
VDPKLGYNTPHDEKKSKNINEAFTCSAKEK